MNTCSKLQKVTLDDFNIAALRKAAREGRLYIQPAGMSPADERECAHREILQYVSRIDSCVNPPYATTIRQLWQRILLEPDIAGSLIITRGKREGKPNWYRITSLVAFLLEKDVYRKKEFTTVDLHLRMEQTSHRNNHYTGSGTVCFSWPQLGILNRILNEFQDKAAEK